MFTFLAILVLTGTAVYFGIKLDDLKFEQDMLRSEIDLLHIRQSHQADKLAAHLISIATIEQKLFPSKLQKKKVRRGN